MNNELQELLVRIIKAVIVAIPIWEVIVLVFMTFVFRKNIKKWWKGRK